MMLSFELPPIVVNGTIPVWTGNGFQITDNFCKVLNYSSNQAGWNDELTFFHEEAAGEQHFIDRASRNHAIQELKKYCTHSNHTILEIGCSSGFMLKRMITAFPKATIIGSDIVIEPLEKLATEIPTIPLFRFDLIDCPLPSNTINSVVILNVLEHIDQDSKALEQIHRILKPGGVVVIEVPAGPHLYDIYDKELMHYRRYKLNDLCNVLEQVGFTIKKKSHLGFFIYPGFSFVKKRNKKKLSAEKSIQQKLVKNNIQSTGNSKILHLLMQMELALGKAISYPIGIRCLITCQK